MGKETEILQELKAYNCFSFAKRAMDYYILYATQDCKEQKQCAEILLKIHEGDEKCFKEDDYREAFNFNQDIIKRFERGDIGTYGLCTSEEGTKIQELFDNDTEYNCFVKEVQRILDKKLSENNISIDSLRQIAQQTNEEKKEEHPPKPRETKLYCL